MKLGITAGVSMTSDIIETGKIMANKTHFTHRLTVPHCKRAFGPMTKAALLSAASYLAAGAALPAAASAQTLATAKAQALLGASPEALSQQVTVSYRGMPDNAPHSAATIANYEAAGESIESVALGNSSSESVDKNASLVHGPEVDNLLDLSFEELLSQEVTSAAKKSRRVGDSAAAVTVITQADIQRSTARTVPDLLRMVPGMEISEVQSSATSVSSRGFTSRFAANMLVMVDGAAIYSTSISGMFWDQALIPLQEIERIEVIRGPGGSLWGSNAMNGIVNIITKQSIDTQGLRVKASVGTHSSSAEVGFAKQINETLGVRIYGDYRRTTGLDGANGPVDGNSWRGGLAGVRVDYAPTSDSTLVLLGELSDGAFGGRVIAVNLAAFPPQEQIVFEDNTFSSKHLLARWKHAVSDSFDYTVQGYFNELQRTEFGAEIDRKLYDASFETRFAASNSHEFNMGIAGRIVDDVVDSSPALMLPGGTNTDRWITGYIQDDITLIPEKLRFTIGSKFEHNNFSGTEVQPSIRAFYRASPDFALWGAVSRAVRTPLLLQREMTARVVSIENIPGSPQPVVVSGSFIGNPNSLSERVTAYEMGMRGELGHSWSFDIAAYYNRYTRLATARTVAVSPLFAPGTNIPIGIDMTNFVGNEGSGRAYGGEVMISGQLTPWWQVESSYSYLNLRDQSPPQTLSFASDGNSPFHQFRLRSDMDFNDRVSLGAFVHYVSAARNRERTAYTDVNLKLTYRLNSQLELSLAGRNLLDKRHLEYGESELPIELSYVPRSAFIEARARF